MYIFSSCKKSEKSQKQKFKITKSQKNQLVVYTIEIKPIRLYPTNNLSLIVRYSTYPKVVHTKIILYIINVLIVTLIMDL